MEKVYSSPRLASLLEGRKAEIQAAWADHLRSLPESHYQQRSETDLSSWTAAGIAAIIESLRTGSKEPLIAHARQISQERRRQGFAINEVVEGLLLMREATLEHLPAAEQRESRDSRNPIRQFDTALRILIARLAQSFAEAMQKSIKEERDRTALLLDVTSVAGESLDLSKLMPEVAKILLSTLGYSYCIIYAWDEVAGIFSTCGEAGDLPSRELTALLKHDLDPATSSLAAEALSAEDFLTYKSASGCRLGEVSCEDLGIAAAVVLPIRLADQLLAFALVLAKQPDMDFDARALELAAGIAKSVAPAVDNCRRHMQMRERLIESQELQKATSSLLEMEGLDDLVSIICRECEALTGAQGSAVSLEADGAVPDLAYRHGEAISWSDEELVNGSRPGTACLRYPLTVRGHRLGNLVLLNQAKGFDDVSQRLASSFADQAAVAVQHVVLRLQQEQLALLEERQNIAHELHDSATQSIYGVTLYSETAARLLEAGKTARATEILRESRDIALEALREMRLLVFELRPPLLEEEGLATALQARLAAVEGRAGLTTEFSGDCEEPLPARVAEALYGIAKEALNNVLKHAKASRVAVRLDATESVLTLEITDNGSGFEAAKTDRSGGMGLRGMRERAASIGANLSISSEPGTGTTILVEAPLNTTLERLETAR
jgi:signal transduction histidine kinase